MPGQVTQANPQASRAKPFRTHAAKIDAGALQVVQLKSDERLRRGWVSNKLLSIGPDGLGDEIETGNFAGKNQRVKRLLQHSGKAEDRGSLTTTRQHVSDNRSRRSWKQTCVASLPSRPCCLVRRTGSSVRGRERECVQGVLLAEWSIDLQMIGHRQPGYGPHPLARPNNGPRSSKLSTLR